jgi:hypothetical protein
MDSVDSIRAALSESILFLDELYDDTGIFDHVDAFVCLSRHNETVEQVYLSIPATDPVDDAPGTRRYAIWDKIAEGIGNLRALRKITIWDTNLVDDEDEVLVPDWNILACILRRLQRGIELCMKDGDDALLWNTAALPLFAGAIRGQAMITGFSTGNAFPLRCLDILCSALLTLPALETVEFNDIDGEGPEEAQSLESMVKLLQSPALRAVTFHSVVFPNTLFQIVSANVLKERSQITDLHFYHCSFPEGGDAVIAGLLETNTTLKSLGFFSEGDEVFYEELASALLSNSTLQKLGFTTFGISEICSYLSPLFLALQVNHGLKELTVYGVDHMDEELSSAMKLGLGENSTLELVNLAGTMGHNDTSMWREAISFLRTNKALKTLNIMHYDHDVTESHAATIRMEVLAMLRENESLETLTMPCRDARFEDYLVLVETLSMPCQDARFEDQPNTTLKRLRLHPSHAKDFCVNEDETKELILVLKKNYGLESIPGFYNGGDIRSILKLNRAGRRYLVLDGSSISKGVDVLNGVSNDINSVFLHLLENPRLCDRSAVEMSSISNIDNASATSPGNHSGEKREQEAPSHTTGNETRRRLE